MLPARVWKAILEGMLEDSVVGDLRRIRAPVHLICGDRDAFSRRQDQDDLLAQMPWARLSVYDEVGHSPQWEIPARFARDLLLTVLDLIAGRPAA